MAIRGAPFAHGRRCGAVGVFDQIARGPSISETCVDGDVGIDGQQAAEREEFIGANIVRLHGVPDRIEDRRAFIDVANAIAPLVRGYEIAARKAEDAEAQLLERGYDLGAEAFYVVRGHERNCADMEGTGASASDLQSCVIGVCRSGVAQRKFAESDAERAEGDGLAIGCFFAPDERDLDYCAWRAGKLDASGVDLAFSNRNSGLADAVRFFRTELNQRRVVSGVGRFGVHGDYLVAADGSPPPRWSAVETRVPCRIAHHRRRFWRAG